MFRKFFLKRRFSSGPPDKSYFKIIEEKFSYTSRLKTTIGIAAFFATSSAIGWFFFQDKFRSVAVKEATVITQKSLEDKDLQYKVNAIAAASTKMILEDTVIYAKLISLIKTVANDEQITSSTSILLQKAINMPEFKQLLVRSLKDLLNDQETQKTVNLVAKRIVNDMLEDDELRNRLVQYLQSVVDDPRLQQSVANSMWKSTKLAFVPKIFK